MRHMDQLNIQAKGEADQLNTWISLSTRHMTWLTWHMDQLIGKVEESEDQPDI
jgi:hypothetical protein